MTNSSLSNSFDNFQGHLKNLKDILNSIRLKHLQKRDIKYN